MAFRTRPRIRLLGAVEVVERVGVRGQCGGDLRWRAAGRHEPDAGSASRLGERRQHAGRIAIRVVDGNPVDAGRTGAGDFGRNVLAVARSLVGGAVALDGAAQARSADLQPRQRRARVGRPRLEARGVLERRQVQTARRDARAQQLTAGDLVGVGAQRASRRGRQAAGNREVQVRIDETWQERMAGAVDRADTVVAARPRWFDGRDTAVAEQDVAPGHRTVPRPQADVADEDGTRVAALRAGGRDRRTGDQQRSEERETTHHGLRPR